MDQDTGAVIRDVLPERAGGDAERVFRDLGCETVVGAVRFLCPNSVRTEHNR